MLINHSTNSNDSYSYLCSAVFAFSGKFCYDTHKKVARYRTLCITKCSMEYLFVQKTAIKDGGDVMSVVSNDAVEILSL